MTEPHRHCRVCGRVSPEGEEYCGAACRRKREALQASRQRNLWVFYALMAVLLIVLVLSYVHL